MRMLSEESCVDHATRYLHAVLEKVLSDKKIAFSFEDFSDCMAIPTPAELLPRPQKNEQATLVLKHRKKNNITGKGYLDIFVY